MIEISKNLNFYLALLSAIIAIWSAIFLFGRLSANINIFIEPKFKKDLLRVRIRIINDGSVRVGIQKTLLSVKFKRINKNRDRKNSNLGTEWIEFNNDDDRIMSSSYFINPKEEISVDRIYRLGLYDYIHVGLQVYLKYNWIISKMGGNVRSSRQTKTVYFLKGENDEPKKLDVQK